MTVAPPVYRYLVADLRTNAILAELPLHDVEFNKPLNASGAFSASWKLDRTPATLRVDPYDLTTPTRRVIYALRDDRPIWGGIIWTAEYDSEADTVRIGAGEFWSYFDHRKLVPVLDLAERADGTRAAPDPYYIAGLSVDLVDVEQNDIARHLVQLAQAHAGGDIGVEVDDTSSGIWRTRHYYGHSLADVGETLRQLCNVIDGPDIVFDVAPGRDGRIRRILRLGTPTLGQQGSGHVWEYRADGGNVLRYSWPRDGTRMVTRAYATGDGVDLGTPIAVTEDRGALATWPLLESETLYSSVLEYDTLQGHADSDQHTGRLPVVLPRITVRGDVAPTAAEIDRGDDGRLVLAPDLWHRHGVDTAVRVVDMKFTPSQDAERVELTLAPLLDDIA